MKILKKVLIIIMILLTLQLNIPGACLADQSDVYAMAETDANAPESQVVLEKDLPEPEQSWFSKLFKSRDVLPEENLCTRGIPRQTRGAMTCQHIDISILVQIGEANGHKVV